MFKEKQRVISRTEPELGLGLIQAHQNNDVKIFFPRTEETRSYSSKSDIPIQRYILNIGDTAYLIDKSSFVVEQVVEEEGLFKYIGSGKEAYEWELSDQTNDLGAIDLFLNGQFSPFKAFDLRKEAWSIRGEARASGVTGLVGPRVSPMPHQLYIAKTVLSQTYPRVLLSDEVGLGKTIEAGLIFSAMKSLDRADKVLILVPESLTHQWLAEMFRKFNELFTVLDVERCQEEELSQGKNIFELNNKFICSSNFLIDNPNYMNQCLDLDWDLIIIDEAHHLKLPEDSEQITNWSLARELSFKTNGLLLLTATPQMQGFESQYSLLHLVDPERFNDFEDFKEQSQKMKKIADIAKDIISKELNSDQIKQIKEMFPNDHNLNQLIGHQPIDKDALLSALVDRHGTGRVFFRNRRERLKGFPQRVLNSIPLDNSKEAPFKWLNEFCNSLGNQKALVICSSKEQVLEIEKWFNKNSTYQLSVFHEDLSIVERDIQAANFAQNKSHRLLVCSEIGGEGRNFQFCHNLVLFDLPHHPDLIEQRIGRLDRIGQKQDIQIHSLWKQQTSQEVYFKWYHEGLNSFEKSWNGAGLIFNKFKAQLDKLCDNFDKNHSNYLDDSLNQLIKATKNEALLLRQQQAESVDILVDINSFNKVHGKALVESIEDRDDDPRLELFIKGLFEYFAIEYTEYDDRGTLLVKGDSLSFIENFPGISSETDTVMAFDRSVALEREDINFITQDHQIAEESLSLLLDRNEGVAAICKWLESPYDNGALVEISALLQVSGPKHLELDKYLNLKTQSFVVNHNGQTIKHSLHLDNPDLLSELQTGENIGDPERMAQFIKPIIDKINLELINWAQPLIDHAVKHAKDQLEKEKQRLDYLLSVNPNINPKEIESFEYKMQQTLNYIKTSKPRIDALRVIFTEPKSF